jgi:diaminohydroxyphosphoribosylaminopyrimidine deaminase/5-amino-6-(5-phosphoribosylamino)uracil reductase
MMNRDDRWMRMTLKLARRGLGQAHPNPMVGAILVKNKQLVAAGHHRRFGGPHAEIEALARAGTKAKGATLYVNLEPCAHWGKTPPCVDALIKAGIVRVVAAMRDPYSEVDGRGFRQLRAAGIEVASGVLEDEARELNRAFLMLVTRKRPYVTLKTAASLDGKIATASGESRWITGPEARAFSHRLRAEVDAIGVGVGTVLSDNPALTAHGHGRNPLRVIFDTRLRTPRRAQCLDGAAPTWILTGLKAKPRWPARRGVPPPVIQTLPKNRQGTIDVQKALARLGKAGVAHLLIEGGGTLAGSFIENDLIDEVIWFLAPKIIGGLEARGAVEGKGIHQLKHVPTLKHVQISRLGNDFCIRGKVH